MVVVEVSVDELVVVESAGALESIDVVSVDCVVSEAVGSDEVEKNW